MANRVLVSVEDGMPEPVWLSQAESFLLKALESAGYDGEELSVMFCSDSCIRKLNRDYRNIDEETDVLSFEDGSRYTDEDGVEWTAAGDIAVSLETLPKNAAYFEVSEDEELKRLLVHGMLHLNGLDHGEEHVIKGKEPVCPMLRKQKELLEALRQETIITEESKG
ncbi:MAG: rRNA maturation RNase YbeY [Treponema sp.]|nr:rRNA maturation RNase YbeY [Treponema sp.]